MPFEQTPRRAHPQSVDLFVDRRFFFYVKVGRRNVGFGLIIIVIRYKILDCVVGKKGLKLLVKLCRQRFVVSDDQRWPLYLLDHVRDRKRLAAARNSQQNLVLLTGIQICYELLDSFGLITLRRVFRHETKLHALIIMQNARRRKSPRAV